jgi:hypothetical protein
LKMKREVPPLPSAENTRDNSVETKLPSEEVPKKSVEIKLPPNPPLKERVVKGPESHANVLKPKEVAPLPTEPISQPLPVKSENTAAAETGSEGQYDINGHEGADPDFDMSLPDAPKQNPAWNDLLVLVDGMNLSFLFKDHREAGDEPRLECIFLVLRTLLATGFPRERIVVYFDANIEERFKECKRYGDLKAFKTYINAQRVPKFRKVPGGIKADTALVALGTTSKRYIVVTNDGLRGYPNARQHRVGVSLDHQTNPLLLVESEEDLSQIAQGKQKRRV